jgi:flagellar basal-body rod protein FlgB
MVGGIDTGLEFFRQVLALRAYRQEVLSADIANASTPGFKAVDLDFAGALAAATARRPASGPPANSRRLWLVDDARQMSGGGGGGDGGVPGAAVGFVKYQADSEVTLDGNSVDLDHEKVTAAENAVEYEAAATFATQTVRMLMIAITGSGSQQTGGG